MRRDEARERAEHIARQMLQLVVDGSDPGWGCEDVLMGLGWALLLTARATREVQPESVALVDETVMTVMGLLLDDCSEPVEANGVGMRATLAGMRGSAAPEEAA